MLFLENPAKEFGQGVGDEKFQNLVAITEELLAVFVAVFCYLDRKLVKQSRQLVANPRHCQLENETLLVRVDLVNVWKRAKYEMDDPGHLRSGTLSVHILTV